MSPVDWAGRLGSYEKFQPGLRDEKRPKTSCGAKFEKQSKHGETRYITWRNTLYYMAKQSYKFRLSHDVTKIQTTKLSILLRFYFHGILEQLKTNFQTNFRFKRVLGFVIEHA